MNKVDAIINQFSDLNKTELKQISEKLLQVLKGVDGVAFAASDYVHKCRRCNSDKVVKCGKDKNGKQRYKCKDCGTYFTEISYSVVSNSHCSMDKWEKYIYLLIQGATLEQCSKECKINIRTAFLWRHKILHALQADQDNRILSGIIEVDDTYVSISYKGNHSKSHKFTMPREPYKRGSDNKSANGSKACVMCAIERNGQFYSEVMGKGQLTTKRVEYAFKNRILPESLVLSDGSTSIKKFFVDNKSIELVQLKSTINPKNKSGGTPEIRGTYHIQTVNNLHRRLRDFLKRYNGVATKYLNHYINLFIWIENHKKFADTNIKEQMQAYITDKDTYFKACDLYNMPSVPCVA